MGGWIQEADGWARALRAQCGLEPMVAVVAYAEMSAIVARGIGAGPPPPLDLARAALVATLDGEWPWLPRRVALVTHLQAHIRIRIADEITAHCERAALVGDGARVPPSSIVRISDRRDRQPVAPLASSPQIGSVEGIARIAHDASERAAGVRAYDAAVRRGAVELVELVADRLAARVCAPRPWPAAAAIRGAR